MLLPWFVYLLVNLGYLNTDQQWFTLSESQKVNYELIITDDVEE